MTIEPYKILYKEQLSGSVYLMRILAPHIAQERQPGQFILLSINHDYGERIPLTIADTDLDEGSITVYLPDGGFHDKSCHTGVGDELAVLWASGTSRRMFEKVVGFCVGGGVGWLR